MKQTLLLFLTLLLFGTALAQSNDSLIVLFLSQPGVRPAAIFTDGFESGNVTRFDFNGDKRADIVMTRNDAQGNLNGILVINAASLDTLWRVSDLPQTLGLAERDGMKLHGFADADGDGTREAVLSLNDEVLLVDPRDPQGINWRSSLTIGFPPELRLIGLSDITDDGFEDIVVALPQERQVVVFGDNPATQARH